jgi:PAS domain S-box-containing protein
MSDCGTPSPADEAESMRAQIAELERQRRDLLRTREVQRSANRVLERLACGAPLEQVLHLLVESVESFNPHLLGSVLLLDPDGRRLRHGAAPSLPEFYNRAIDGLEIGPAVGSCGTCAYTGERIIVDDVETHPYWSGFRELARRAGLRACWSHPIASSTGRILGTFAMYYREPRRPDHADLELITFAAHVAGIAIERSRTVEALRAGEEHFRALVESAPVCIYELDTDGAFLSMNPAGLRHIGARHESEVIGRRFLECVDEPVRTRVDGFLRRALSGRPAEFEFSSSQAAGTRTFASSLVPLRDSVGRVVKVMGVAQDVTERRHADGRRALMVQELDHRVKNNLAVVLSIAEQTAVGVESLEEFQEAFRGRIRSMAVAHELLARSGWEGLELSAMLMRVLEPYRRDDSGRIELSGPEVRIPSRIATPICMVIHELVVNAAKYGALSREGGRVLVHWGADPAAPAQLTLRWTETGGPPVSPPRRRGRGTALIERMVGYQLRGRSRLDFAPAGVRCTLSVPVGNGHGLRTGGDEPR